MSAPLLSIVIPTRDRRGYAVHCVRSLARLPGELEFVVQDNSSDDALGRALAAAGDPRVAYQHSAEPLSVIDNCSRAMARARGEYVTLLGDDDGVSAALPEVAAWAAAAGVDAVTPGRLAWYVWPDVTFRRARLDTAGTLTVRPYSGRVTPRDPEEGVRRSLRAGLQDLVDSVALPKLYYGLVRRRCLEALVAEAGTVFPGVSPDMSAAMALTRHVRGFVHADFPLFLPGTSARSTAGAQARKEHVGRLEDQPHLPRGCAATWPLEVPALFTPQTVWAQSGVAALRATGRGERVRELDLGMLHAMTGALHRGTWSAVLPSYWRAVDAAGWSRPRGALALAGGLARTWEIRLRARVGLWLRAPHVVGEHRESGLPDIGAAVAALDTWIARRGVALAFPGRAG